MLGLFSNKEPLQSVTVSAELILIVCVGVKRIQTTQKQ